MLPNWLYGKSKSKLQEILGGGGGGGASYTAASNPNILHNPWFTVNQRGATSVTASNGFIADRWRVYTTLASFKVTRNSDGYIVIDNTSGDAIITVFQKRTSTYINSLHGKKVTASVMFSDGTIKSGSITFDSTQSGTYYSDDDYALNYNPTSGSILAIVVRAGKTATIKALKLEVGEISTLHLDPRPEYATELAKCQRYFQRINLPTHSMLLAGITRDTSNATLTFPLPEMRSTPTYTASGIQYRGSSNSVLTFTLDNVEMHKGGFICVNFRSGNHTAWQPIAIRAASDSGGYIDFAAEL